MSLKQGDIVKYVNPQNLNAVEYSGCFFVGDVEFACGGRADDKARAEAYAAWLQSPSMAGFFALPEVQMLQEAMKHHPYKSKWHKSAYLRLCDLASQNAEAAKQFNPKDY